MFVSSHVFPDLFVLSPWLQSGFESCNFNVFFFFFLTVVFLHPPLVPKDFCLHNSSKQLLFYGGPNQGFLALQKAVCSNKHIKGFFSTAVYELSGAGVATVLSWFDLTFCLVILDVLKKPRTKTLKGVLEKPNKNTNLKEHHVVDHES